MHLYLQALCSGLFLIGQVNASPAPIVEERGTCNQDNLLNALENPNNIQSAYQFCSAYISVPEVTIVTTYTVSLSWISGLAGYSSMLLITGAYKY